MKIWRMKAVMAKKMELLKRWLWERARDVACMNPSTHTHTSGRRCGVLLEGSATRPSFRGAEHTLTQVKAEDGICTRRWRDLEFNLHRCAGTHVGSCLINFDIHDDLLRAVDTVA